MSVTRGDVIHMKSFKHCEPGLEVSYKANPDKVAVFLLLGQAPRKEPSLFDPNQALNVLGWVRNEGAVEAAPKLLEALKHMVACHYPDANGQIGAQEECWAAIQNAKSAIAAATGES